MDKILDKVNNPIPLKKGKGVYILFNKSNNKFYIGSAKNINTRKNHHFSDLKLQKHRNDYLQKAYNKSPNDFEYFVYEYCDDKKQCYNISKVVKGNSISVEGRKILSEKEKQFHIDNPLHKQKLLN